MSNNQYPYNVLKCFNDNNRCRPLYGFASCHESITNIVDVNDAVLNPGCYYISYDNSTHLIHIPYSGKIKFTNNDKIILSADNGKYIKLIPYKLLTYGRFVNGDSVEYGVENLSLINSICAPLSGFNIYGRCDRTVKTSINTGATSSPISSITLTIDSNTDIIELPTVLRNLPRNDIYDECILNFDMQIANSIIRIGRCVLGGLSFEIIENKSDNNSTLLFAKYDAIGTCDTNESELWCSHFTETTYNNIMIKEIYNAPYISLSRDIDGGGLYVRIPTTIASKNLCKSYLHSRISTNPIIVEYPLNEPQYKVNLLQNYNFKTTYNRSLISIDSDVENIMYKYMIGRA